MRNYLILMSATALAACGGGGGPEAVGGAAPPPTPGGGSTPTPTDAYSQFANPVDPKTYVGVGTHHVYEYLTDERQCCEQQAQIYAGSGSTVRDSGISISYNPRDAVFTLSVEDPMSGAATQTRFQDPASRTDFDGALQPQWGAPDLANAPAGATDNLNVRYLQAGDGDPRSPWSFSGNGTVDPGDNLTPADGTQGSSYTSTTLFYEKPGSTTRYVSFAGYLRNSISFSIAPVFDGNGDPVLDADGEAVTAKVNNWHLERGAFAYGALTANSAVPGSGTATFTGSMLGSLVFNPLLDTNRDAPTYFQWVTGSGSHVVDFGTLGIASTFRGSVYSPQIDRYTSGTGGLPAGTRFDAVAQSRIDLINTGGFRGSFGSASFTRPDGTSFAVQIAGSSIDGAFYGPAAEEIGGGFRIVGGTPDERIDIIGAFTGKK